MTQVNQHNPPDAPAPQTRRQSKIGPVRILAFFSGLVVTLFVGGFLFFVNEIPKTGPASPPRADGIVALTGAADRIEIAVGLLRSNKARRLLISGVNPTTTSAALANAFPQYRDLFDCCIDLDYRALNTVGNADQTRKWVQDNGFTSIIVVTSNYHMPRSLIEIERAMPDTSFIAYPVLTDNVKVDRWWSHPGSLQLLVSEYIKYLEALVRSIYTSTAVAVMDKG